MDRLPAQHLEHLGTDTAKAEADVTDAEIRDEHIAHRKRIERQRERQREWHEGAARRLGRARHVRGRGGLDHHRQLAERVGTDGVAFGDAIEQAVAKVAPLFDKNPTQQTDADVARRAAEAISKAKNPVATSLSQAPAGSKPMHDEGEVMRNMDINRLSQSLESKSPEEIMKIMAKAL